MNTREIHCSACGADTLVRPEPIYEGFQKIGEEFVCTACGHRYASEKETPFISKTSKPNIFGDDAKPQLPKIFSDDELRRSCLHCREYVVSPFGQRCGFTNRPVEATDLCVRFVAREEKTN